MKPQNDKAHSFPASFQLLNSGKIDLLTSAEGVVFYKLKGASKASGVRGDQEEKIVFGIIEEAGNKGTWIRDIRIKSNLGQVSAWSAKFKSYVHRKS